jgi:hypothetical protein
MIVADQLRTITIICEVDRWAHEITEEDVAAGRRSGNRRYQAICGYHFKLPASRVVIAAPPCEQCAAVLVAANQPEPTAHRTRRPRRRLGWWWS